MLVIVLLQHDMLNGGPRVAQAAVEWAARIDGIGTRGAIQKLNRLEPAVRGVCSCGPERGAVGQRRRVAGIDA